MKKPFSKLFNLIDKSETRADDDSLVTVPIEHIVPNQYQPRTVFNHQRIEELAHSIKAHGLLQPITLRPIEEGMYEIIAGERRFRALKYLGYEDTQAIVKYLTDQESAAIALIENIQRENLSSIEEARAYKQLLQMDDITERHARALLILDNDTQCDVLKNIVKDNLTVKETELAVKNRQKVRIEQINFNDDVAFMLNDFERDIKKLQDKGIDVNIETSETDELHEVTIRIYK